ncbi:MAG: DUF58 domain-containing protein [Alphaproteobacteria bacterium]|nr:DUF58 domain-containing protein [Alphaproteobacteria bacterium]
MITPTSRAIVLAALGAPASLLFATMIAPSLWLVGAVWAFVVAVLCIADAMLASAPKRGGAVFSAPNMTGIGAGAINATLGLDFRGPAPRRAEVMLDPSDIVRPQHLVTRLTSHGREARGVTTLAPLRRGEARFANVHARWRGPLGLAWRQSTLALDARIAVTPDLGGVQRHAERLFSRTLMHGIKPLRDRGEGSEFDALAEFQSGMDRRLVEWKQSARHIRLLAKEVRAERNHQLAFAIDTGRAMCEPIAGTPRVDWAINAALLLAYVGLKIGDRASFFSFDSKPRIQTGLVSGVRSFPHLLAHTASLDYAAEETNYTWGIATLAESLKQRSMVIVFTDFTDAVSAELMVETIARLTRRHLVVFVTFPDNELEAFRDHAPVTGDDVSRSVIAQRLLQDRDIVIARLKRLGVHIVSAPVEELGPALVRAYDLLRRKERV